MDWKEEWKPLALISAVFALCYFLPVDWLQASERLQSALWESLHLVKWYAREHVLLCLVPAFFIAGAVGVFVSQDAVMRYLGPQAKKLLAYGVASVSGSVLAVCSCTILPLFAGIYRMGAGLGPACAFLYSGPAINILAIVLTARILGPQMGIARAVGAVTFSIVIGLLMQLFFRREEAEKVAMATDQPEAEVERPLWQTAVYFAARAQDPLDLARSRGGDGAVAGGVGRLLALRREPRWVRRHLRRPRRSGGAADPQAIAIGINRQPVYPAQSIALVGTDQGTELAVQRNRVNAAVFQ